MCLALLAPKGVLKNTEFLYNSIKTASYTNRDGMGFAFKRNSTKKVYISKGYKDVDEFIDSIKEKKLGLDDELIVHLRIGNKGSVNTDMCHPFVVSSEDDEILQNDKFVTEPVFIHNGTLFKYSEHNSKYSDTFFFSKKFMSHKPVQEFLKSDSKLFSEIFKDHVSTSRFVFLFPGESNNAIKIGSFKEDNGYFFSNESYKNSNIRNVGGVDTEINYNSYNGYCNYGESWKTRKARESINESIIKRQLENKSVDLFEEDPFEVNTNSKVKESKKRVFDNSASIKIPKTSKEKYTCPLSGADFTYYMGLWIPEEYIINQNLHIRIDVNSLNYTHLQFRGLDNLNGDDITKNRLYEMTYYGIALSHEKGETMHVISPTYGVLPNNRSNSYIYDHEIKTILSSKPKSEYTGFYDSYMDLVRRVDISKNKIKKLTKMLNAPYKEDMYYEKLGYYNREVLQLFLYNMYKEFYPETYMEEFNDKTFNQQIK